jgi:biopolymer transport protein ExbB
MFTTFRLPALAAVLTIVLATAATAQTPTAPASAPTAPAATTQAAPPPADSAAPAPAAAPDTAAPPAAAPAVAAPAADTVAVDNPYGIEALWAGGGVIAKTVLAILAIMSFLSWYILVVKMWEQSRLLAAARAANRSFWSGNSVTASIGTLKASSPFRYIAESGASATEHHEGTLVEQIDLHSWVTMSVQRAVDEISNRLRGGLWVLATIGSTAPFVGLFGTVIGIYNALTAIGIAGQASIDKVAGPVGEALIMTAFGLFVAVPAVLGYNILVSRNKSAMEKVRNFSADLHSVLLSGTRVGETAKPVARIA